MNRSAVSADGTKIAYSREGTGPPVVLVGGSLDDGRENGPLATVLSRRHDVVNYARRGREPSGDTLPYAVEREVEDLAALIDGAPATVVGISTGGALALRAAAAGLPITCLVLYEVPYAVPGLQAYADELAALLAAGRRGDAIAHFMRLAGSSEDSIAGAREWDGWPALEALAHTLAYDAAVLSDPLPLPELPVLVLTGGGDPFFEAAADQLAAQLPNATRQVLEGQGHVADPEALAAALERHGLHRSMEEDTPD